jgi:alkanesulfonate monooxygenase SsuD/methylene tetrahydromethanopterin reductase-like flavin-dependent oxidoreductase (luciferase family)
MKFGIFDHLERRHDCDLTQQYEERLQLMAQADAAGIYGYHIAEHHHSPLCLAPNQSVFLAAAAQRTKNLKIGSLVYVLPLYHPIRILEEICMVDRLSNGRVQVGIGKGVLAGAELAAWGGNASDADGLFRETLEILLKGFKEEFLSYEGEHYQFKDLWMELRPVQKPHPAFWYAGNPLHAGELGMNFIGAGPMWSVKRAVATYLAALRQSQTSPSACTATLNNPLYGGMRHTFIADTDAEAIERAREAYEVYRRHFAKPQPPGEGPSDGSQQVRFVGPAVFTPDQAMSAEILLCGSPSTIRDYALRYVDESDANYYVSAFQWGDLTHQESSKSLRLFAEEVMPAIERAGAQAAEASPDRQRIGSSA